MNLTIPARSQPVTIDTERTALIVVDMQNAFCRKEGMFASLGMFNETKVQPVIQTNKKVIEAVRRRGFKIIYLRMGYRPDLADAGGPQSPNYWREGALVAMHEHPELKHKVLTTGTWDWEIIDELKPQPSDIIVNKNRYSGFPNTQLDVILKTNNLKYLLFIGLFTNVCVESTIRDAYFHEYFPILISDACGNCGPDFNQEATIWNVSNIFGWVTTADELVQALQLF
jgi:ureidoacrylate peracid hydrolase